MPEAAAKAAGAHYGGKACSGPVCDSFSEEGSRAGQTVAVVSAPLQDERAPAGALRAHARPGHPQHQHLDLQARDGALVRAHSSPHGVQAPRGHGLVHPAHGGPLAVRLAQLGAGIVMHPGSAVHGVPGAPQLAHQQVGFGRAEEPGCRAECWGGAEGAVGLKGGPPSRSRRPGCFCTGSNVT